MSGCRNCLVHALDEWLESFADDRPDVGDELYRPHTEMRAGLVNVPASPAVRTERDQQMPPLPRQLEQHHRPPEVAHVEVSTARNEARALAQLRQQGTVGWLTHSRGGPGQARQPPQGLRGLAIEHPDGSIVYTVYSPDMRTVEYRQKIRPAHAGPRVPRRPPRRPRTAQERRQHAQAVLRAAADRERRARNAINRVASQTAPSGGPPAQRLIRAKPNVTGSGPDLVPGPRVTRTPGERRAPPQRP